MMLYQIFEIDENYNILVSLKGITTLQKSSFSLTLCDSSFFFCSKGMKVIQAIKITVMFRSYFS